MWKLWLQRPEDGQVEKVLVGTSLVGRQQPVFPKPCLRVRCDMDTDSQEKRIYSQGCDQILEMINGSLGAESESWSKCTDLLDTNGGTFFPHHRLAPQGINCCREKLSQQVRGHFLWALQAHVLCRGSWLLLPSQEPGLRECFTADTKDHSWEEPLVQSGGRGVPEETTSKVKGLEEEDQDPTSPAPPSLDPSLMALGQSRLLGALTHLWPLGLVLAQQPLSLSRAQRHLLLQACLQLPSSSQGRFSVHRGQFQREGVTSIRAPPQAAIHLHVKSPLQFGGVLPRRRSTVEGLNDILIEKHCSLINS